ncbi:Zinc finger FYVE/PHD-type [Trinorchestia longiramus]|nr:Zinc finger FYVE/PHD-type [Trinorchestia longiramus]
MQIVKVIHLTLDHLDDATLDNLDGATVDHLDVGTVDYLDGVTVDHLDDATLNNLDGVTVDHFDGATVDLLDGVTVDHLDGVTVDHLDGVTVDLLDGVTVDHLDGVTVDHLDDATLNNLDGVTVDHFGATVDLLDGVTVDHFDGATVDLLDGVTVDHLDGVTVDHLDGVTVDLLDGVTVDLLDGVTVDHLDDATLNNLDGVTVDLLDGVTVDHLDGVTVDHLDGPTVDPLEVATLESFDSTALNYLDDVTLDYLDGGTLDYLDDVTLDYLDDVTLDYLDDVTLDYLDDVTLDYLDDVTLDYLDDVTLDYLDDATLDYLDDVTLDYLDDVTLDYLDDVTLDYLDDVTLDYLDVIGGAASVAAPSSRVALNSTMTHCDQCSAKFSLLKRKHICDACRLDHCSDCLTRTPLHSSPQQSSFSATQTQYQQQTASSFVAGLNNFANSLINAGSTGSSNVRRNCRKCQVFLQWPVNVAAVAALRVKDLRFYLSRHQINASTCTEKSELIALVVNQLRKYRLQQHQEHQQRQSYSSSSTSPPNPQHQNYRSNGGMSSHASSQSSSGHLSQPFSRSSEVSAASSVIRDDGIRVQGMSAADSYNYDSDSIRVYASTRLASDRGTSNISPSNSEEDDGFVVVGHGDVLPSDASPPLPPHSYLYSAHCDSSVDSSSNRNIGNNSSLNTGSNGSSSTARESTWEESATGSDVPFPAAPNASNGQEEPESSMNNNVEQSTRQEPPKSTNSPPVAGATGEEVPSSAESRDTKADRLPGHGNRASLCELDYIKLDDLADEESVRALTVRQCRVLLAKHRVTATAIIEKEHLVDRVLTLWRSYKDNQKSVDEVPDRLLCKICMEAVIDCVLLECSHMVCCTDCGRQLSECPVCRQFVVRCVHTFLA